MNKDIFKSLWYLILGVGFIIISILSEGWALIFNLIFGVGCLFYSTIKGWEYL